MSTEAPADLLKRLEGATPAPVRRDEVLDAIPWNADGLIPAVAQQHDSGEVLMLAWMNRAALEETLNTSRAVYWSRSRARFWRKGEESGNVQRVLSAALDCDGDALVLQVDQTGAACHTGRRSCFYIPVHRDPVEVVTPQLQDPNALYGPADD